MSYWERYKINACECISIDYASFDFSQHSSVFFLIYLNECCLRSEIQRFLKNVAKISHSQFYLLLFDCTVLWLFMIHQFMIHWIIEFYLFKWILIIQLRIQYKTSIKNVSKFKKNTCGDFNQVKNIKYQKKI